MLFHVIAIKEINQKKINLEFLIEAEKEGFLREIFIESGVVLLDLVPYKWLRSSFQNYYLDVGFVDSRENLIKDSYFRLIPKSNDVDKTVLLFLYCGFLVKNFNYISKKEQISQKKVDLILQKLRKKINYFLEKQKTVVQKYNKSKNKLYSNKGLDLTRRVSEQMVLEIEEFLSKYKNQINPNKLKPLFEVKEELKKLKLGSNEEKIAEDFDIAFSLMEQIELFGLTSHSLDTNPIFEGTQTTYFDVDHELRIFDKTQKMKLIWWKIESSGQYYLIFGKLWFYFKFILVDIKKFFTKILNYTRLWIKYILFSILLSLIFLLIFFVINNLFSYSIMSSLFLAMIFLWELWLLLYFYLLLSKKWWKILFLFGFLILIFVFIVVFNLTLSNFAL